MQPRSIVQLIFVPADGIRLPILGSGDFGTSPFFWAAPSQGNQLDRASHVPFWLRNAQGIRIESSRVILAGGRGRVSPIFYYSAVVPEMAHSLRRRHAVGTEAIGG